MIAAESARDDGIEAVSIVTPNNVHFPVAKACLEAGIHVICDKPITVTCAEADELIELAKAQNRILAVTENSLTLRVYGTRGGLSWHQESPNELEFSPFGESPLRISRGSPAASSAAAAVTRISAGHPEGYLERFATLYKEIAAAICAARSGTTTNGMFPRGEYGRKGIAFVEAAVKSSKGGAVWVNL